MKYQAVILNFDNRTAKYVGVQEAGKLKSQPVAATRTGTAPPPPKHKH